MSLEPGDFYYEGPYLVFTEAYHLKRGYCCGSGCRHCPYGGQQKAEQPAARGQLELLLTWPNEPLNILDFLMVNGKVPMV